MCAYNNCIRWSVGVEGVCGSVRDCWKGLRICRKNSKVFLEQEGSWSWKNSETPSTEWKGGHPLTSPPVRYHSPMDLQQVGSAPPSSTIPFPSSSPSYFHHISDTPPFVPVPLVSSFVPPFYVSLISVPMSPWSSCLLHIVFLPHSCLSVRYHISYF